MIHAVQHAVYVPCSLVKTAGHKAAVVALYTLIASLHLAEAPLALMTGNIHHMKLNWTTCKVAFYALYTFTLPKNNPYESRFDFHHLSYGMAFMLLPGRPTRFGKWMTFDSLVNFNHLGVFYGACGKPYFCKKDKAFVFIDQADRLSPEGTLCKIGAMKFMHRGKPMDEWAFPADNCFVRQWRPLLKEMFYLQRATPLLDAISRTKNGIIDQVVSPFLAKIRRDPTHMQLKIRIDLNLFKT